MNYAIQTTDPSIKSLPEWARSARGIQVSTPQPSIATYRPVRVAIRLDCGDTFEARGVYVRHLDEVWLHPLPPASVAQTVVDFVVRESGGREDKATAQPESAMSAYDYLAGFEQGASRGWRA
jgi:hypothetical protein